MSRLRRQVLLGAMQRRSQGAKGAYRGTYGDLNAKLVNDSREKQLSEQAEAQYTCYKERLVRLDGQSRCPCNNR